jgi:hypothetical protein
MTKRDAIADILLEFLGKPIWDVMAGPVHGSTLILQIGACRRRKVPLTNLYASEKRRSFEGEFVLVISCAWRFSLGERVVCGSLSRNDSDGDIVGGVTQLLDRTIVAVDVDRTFLDFSLKVGGGELSVFCDEVDLQSGHTNYHVTLENSIVVVGPGSVARTEPRDLVPRPPLRGV